MKKLLFIFSICCLSYTAAFSQDDVYYSDDASQPAAKVSITVAPPEIPVYEQPVCPEEGFLWTPGYWAWGIAGYYWVPGVWVRPPHMGWLWTPGYWGFAGGYYGWHRGYWGEHIGFYGGVNYGFGYYGTGFYGGRWEGGAFRYNTAVCRVNTTVIHNTYQSSEGVARVTSHVSYNGPGGINAQPNSVEHAAMTEGHAQPTSEQQSHAQAAGKDRNQYASANHGRPSTAAMSTPNGQHFNQSGRSAKPFQANAHPSANTASHNNGDNMGRSNEAHSNAPATNHRNNEPRNFGAGHTNSAPHNSNVQQQHSAQPRSMPHNAPQQHSAPHNSAPRGGGGGGHATGGGHGGKH